MILKAHPIARKELLHSFLLAAGYAAVFYCLQFFLHKAGMVGAVPDAENLLHWDGGWYKSVAERGYEFHKEASTSGFFILFPAIWKLTHASVWGICIINILFFSAGFSILCRLFSLRPGTQLLWLSVPTVYFAFVPYTEALFFLLGSTLLYGIVRQKNGITWLSLLLLSLTRVTTIFLLPGLLLMVLVANERRYWYAGVRKFMWLYLSPVVLGLAAFIIFQYVQTGVWFAYFIQQSENWGHIFMHPTFPFNSLSGNRTMWLSALAAVAGVVSFVMLIMKSVAWLARGRREENGILITSCVYLLLILAITIFCNPSYGGNNGTNPTGIFRYTMMSPFFYVFLHYFSTGRAFRAWHYAAIILLANFTYLAFGSYVHIQALLYFNFSTLLIVLYMMGAKKENGWQAGALIAINFFMQVQLFQQFISTGIFPD
ncbi:MAG: hypothetical protein V4649_17175 [Bacteroidota bacterium]